MNLDRWSGRSIATPWVSSGQLARAYGFTDLDGSRPEYWRYSDEILERGLEADVADYR